MSNGRTSCIGFALAMIAATWHGAAAQATVTGTVFDSLHANAPLAGANVVIVELSRYVAADSRGRFHFDSVPAGKYAITFLHPSLDSLDVAAEIVPLEVPERGTVNVRLSTPSSRGAYSRLCPGARDLSTGLVFGRVRDVDDASPLGGAIVTAAWTEYGLDKGRMQSKVVRANAVTNPRGAYVLCGLPADVVPQIYVLANGFGAGPVTPSLDPQGMAHLNVAVSRGDTAARLTPEQLVDPARVNKVGAGGGSGIAGVVRGEDAHALPVAVVSVAGSDREVRVDGTGHFRIAGVAAGTRTIEVRSIGLAPATLVVDLKSGADLDTVVTMQRRAQSLAEVSVLGKKPPRRDLTGFEERMHTAVGHFITAADIEKRPAVSMEALLVRVPQLHMTVTPGGGWLVQMRGGNSASHGLCNPSIFVDGMPASIDILDKFIWPADIKGIEVYTQGEIIPPQFDRSGRSLCGSIIVWTKM